MLIRNGRQKFIQGPLKSFGSNLVEKNVCNAWQQNQIRPISHSIKHELHIRDRQMTVRVAADDPDHTPFGDLPDMIDRRDLHDRWINEH